MKKKKVITKVMAMLLTFAVVLSMMPVGAVFGSSQSNKIEISIEDCHKIGEWTEYPIYYYEVDGETSANNVKFNDFSGDSMPSMIISAKYASVLSTNEAPINDNYIFTEDIKTYEFDYEENYNINSIVGNYCYFVYDELCEPVIFVVKLTKSAADNFGEYPFYSSAGSVTSYKEKGYSYSYYDYSESKEKVLTVDLYTVTVPYGTESVTLIFKEDRIVYAYDKNSNYLYSCADNEARAYENNGKTGMITASATSDKSGKMPDYIHVQTPYNDSGQSDTLYAVNFVYNYTFEASVDGMIMNDITYTPSSYSYYDYMTGKTTKVPVYKIAVPAGTQKVDLKFSDNVLAYSYTKSGDYLSGWYSGDSYMTGVKNTSVSVDYGTASAPADGEIDYIQIQTPYDSAWNSTLMYAITFEYIFEAKADGNTSLNSSVTDIDYTDSASKQKVPVYEVSIPESCAQITINFKQKVLPYNYSGTGTCITEEYTGETLKNGVNQKKISTDADNDGILDYIQVKSPCNDAGKSDLLYVISFKTVKISEETESSSVDSYKLMDNIAKSCTDSCSDWVVMDMGAYAKYNPDTENKLSENAKQQYINNAIASITGENASDTDIDKAVLALRAIGADETKLYRVNDNTPINAIEKLNEVTKSSSAWKAPYTLAAYNQGEHNSDEYENKLISDLLAAQQDDGSWNEYGTIDTTANVIAGLSFYKDREDVAAAIAKAVTYLSGQQKTTGAYDGGYGENANSTAMVIIGLTAAGINPDTDSRFIKNGNSALDGLLSFALSDNSGFWYNSKESGKDSSATEQSFRALIAATQVMKTGEAYNVYDFSSNEVQPARATGSSASATPATPTGDNITVSVTIKSDTEYWLNNYSVTIPGEGATVYHAFTKACSDNNITSVGAANGYVSSISKGTKTLAEFDKGQNSGWMYKVNGTLPDVGLTSYSINNGDNIVWFYTTDWTTVPGITMGDQSKSQVTTTGTDTKTTTAPAEVKTSGTTATATVTDETAAELVKQAKENNSKEVVISASSANNTETVNFELPKSTLETISKDTSATVTVKTDAGEINLDKVTLDQIAGEASGKTVVIEIGKVSEPDKTQKAMIGTNGQVFRLSVKSGDTVISQFKGYMTVRFAVPDVLKDKDIAAVHIGDNALEKLEGMKITQNKVDYYEFKTPHFSEFALVDTAEVKLDADSDKNTDKAKSLIKELKLSVVSSKTSKKNVKITVKMSSKNKALIKELSDMGYTVKYKYCRSVKKASKYTAVKTKTSKTFINTKGKKGTKYYYKVKAVVYDGSKVVAQSALSQCNYSVRTWSK